jgi:predicted Zn-dependent protease
MSLMQTLYRYKAMALLVFGRTAAAQGVFDTMLREWPGNAYALSSRVHTRLTQGDKDGAIADAQELVRLHPDRSAADWFNLAFMLEEQNRVEEAEVAFRRATTLDDKLDRAWYGLGLTLIRLNRLDDAAAALKRNTQLQPMSPYGWYQLARVHVDRQKPDEAVKVIQHLRKFEPKVADQLVRETGLKA